MQFSEVYKTWPKQCVFPKDPGKRNKVGWGQYAAQGPAQQALACAVSLDGWGPKLLRSMSEALHEACGSPHCVCMYG